MRSITKSIRGILHSFMEFKRDICIESVVLIRTGFMKIVYVLYGIHTVSEGDEYGAHA